MKIEIRILSQLRMVAMLDLARPHQYAFERVGFFSSVTSKLAGDHHLILLTAYHPVQDEHYINDESVGASIGPEAIREAMTRVLETKHGQIHVHVHEHFGRPHPSSTDKRGLPPLARSMSIAGPAQTSGYIILSSDSGWAELTLPESDHPVTATKITSVGFPHQFLL